MPVPMMMPPMVVVPAMAPVMMVPVMMVVPAHFGREVFRILLNSARRTGIDQRHCLGALDWSRHDKKRANSRQAQNFRSVHINLLKFFRILALRRTADLRRDAFKR